MYVVCRETGLKRGKNEDHQNYGTQQGSFFVSVSGELCIPGGSGFAWCGK
jgi:hypothetical protein